MKIVSFLFVLVSCIYISEAQQTLPACSSVITRPEVRSMSQTQWTTLGRTLARMRDAGWFAWFSRIHATNFGSIHGNGMFFPFHRLMVQDFERVGRAFSASFVVPYWDSARDYVAPHNSVVLTSRWVGGNGVADTRCVIDGIQANWRLTYPNSHCLRRRYNAGTRINSWYSPEYLLSRLLRDTTIATLRPDIEYSIHGAVHLGLGGDMTTGDASNDFVFYMHHANIDRLWWKWQRTNNRMWTMDGPGPNGISNLTINNQITYYNQPIRNVMQLGFGNMCFTYADSAPLAGNAAPSAASTSSTTSLAVASAPAPADTSDSSESLAASSVESSLPSDLLTQFFPGTTSSAPSNSLSRRQTKKVTKVMPLPSMMPASFIRMHKYDYEDVKAHYKEACNFVEALNGCGYEPVYV